MDHYYDPDEEKYEDFLDRLPEDMRESLADGGAYVVRPLDGYDTMTEFVTSAREENDLETWKAFVAAVETEDEAKQKLAEILSLEKVANAIVKNLTTRLNDIHVEGCEKCRAKQEDQKKKGNKTKRALGAARDAFMQAMEDDGEDWDTGLADPNAWMRG